MTHSKVGTLETEGGEKVGFISLGCPKALVDSERILTQLRIEGYEITPHYEDAGVVIVNTCGLIDAAKDESLEAIGEAISENGRVLVTGYADTDAVVDAINKGQVYRFVSKPWNEEELRGVIKAAHALNRARVNSARQGHQVLSALDGFAAEAERLQGMAQASGDGLAHSLAADLRQLEEGIRAERVRYGKWIAEQQGKA